MIPTTPLEKCKISGNEENKHFVSFKCAAPRVLTVPLKFGQDLHRRQVCLSSVVFYLRCQQLACSCFLLG